MREKVLSPQAIKLLRLLGELLGASEEELSAFLKIVRKAKYSNVTWKFDWVEVDVKHRWPSGLWLRVRRRRDGVEESVEVEI